MAHELKAHRFLHGNSRRIALVSVIASLLYFFLSSPQSRAADLSRASIADQLVGGEFSYVVQKGDSLTSIGARFGASVRSIAARNGLSPTSLLKIGQQLKIDNRHIVPDHDGNEIVINIPQRMLFYFSDGRQIHAFPVALGRPDWPTPTGKFQVAVKEENPTWEVPQSIQEEMRREGQVVRTCVPPGPDNPLGSHWLGLSIRGYGIHGTIAPASIYHFQTHGCIRLHRDDIAKLFDEVSIGTPVKVVYQDLLMAKVGGQIYLEAHNDVYKQDNDIRGRFQAMIDSYNLESAVDRELAEDIIHQREGIAREITKGNGANNLP